jgi:pimeloyl-ACP methyl ester carboxylesterase
MDQSKKMNVYFISGLGADRRAFQKISLPGSFIIHHLDWIKPEKKETLPNYAKRFSQLIDTSQPFALVGLSFGGMIACAMNEFIRPEKTILLSSIGCSKELPWYFRLTGYLKLHRLIPLSLLNHPNKVAYWLFGAKRPVEKNLLRHIIADGDPEFIRWAFNALLKWRNDKRPQGLFHIHGSRDKILPLRFTKPDVVIENGSHFMVWTRAKEVSDELSKALLK